MSSLAINHDEHLILIVKFSDGDTYMAEDWKRAAAPTRTKDDVQSVIDSIVRHDRYVSRVFRLDLGTGTTEEISADYDLRTMEQIEEDTAEAEALSDNVLRFSPANQYGTLNHRQQFGERL